MSGQLYKKGCVPCKLIFNSSFTTYYLSEVCPSLAVTTNTQTNQHVLSWLVGGRVCSQSPSDSEELKQAETSVKAHCGAWRITVFIALREPGRMGSSPRILALLLLIWGPWRTEGKRKKRRGKKPKPLLFRLLKNSIKGLVCALDMSQCRLSLVTD